ncbi:MAG TPA: diaminopimelate decarboxylase [Candidatus Baltobacteraceae bacterium]|nr:diaminopimelate decarboxylase [Candidatus Baltobacteraceae bacterium]
MLLGGVHADELARIYGTPLVTIDVDAIDSAIAALEEACRPHAVEISYAAKAFVCIAFVRHLATRGGIGLDVCSLGELLTAERAGFPAQRITLHGAGKSDAELAAAVEGRVGSIAVDGIEELERLSRAASGSQSCAGVLLRLNTGIAAHTHEFVRTGGDDTKFGIHPRDEETAAAILQAHPNLRFAGVHAHIGSQIYQPQAFTANARALVEGLARFARRGLTGERVVVGGGFGVQMEPSAADEVLDVRAAIDGIARCVAHGANELGLDALRIGIEPGRFIVAPAGTTLYRVLAVKRQTSRTFVVVDGGMAENPRPALYGAYHHVVPVAQHDGEQHDVTLCGHSCENDELGVVRLPVDVRAGELLAMRTTGAYTYSMAGNYNRFERPAVVAVGGGVHRLWIRRETVDDVLGNDVDV